MSLAILVTDLASFFWLTSSKTSSATTAEMAMRAATITMIENEYQSVTRAVIGMFASACLILNNIAKPSFSLDRLALAKLFSYVFYKHVDDI